MTYVAESRAKNIIGKENNICEGPKIGKARKGGQSSCSMATRGELEKSEIGKVCRRHFLQRFSSHVRDFLI